LSEVVDRNLNLLQNLGNQRFGLPPFYDHFDRWFMNLKSVISDFESSPAVKTDDQFMKESTHILSDLESSLNEIQLREISGSDALRSLADAKVILERIEEEYVAKKRNIEQNKERNVAVLTTKVNELKKEQNRIAQLKTSLFSGFSKKAKAKQEAETAQKLNSAEKELATTVQSFIAKEGSLRDEYEKRKQPIFERILNHQKEFENLRGESQADGSIEVRRVGCEAIISAIKGLLERTSTPSDLGLTKS
jgi:hypothetical protein